MTVLEDRYRTVTPLFLQGAEGSTPALRPPSFRGVLRWWWRALAWSDLGQDLRALRRQETRLFGSAAKGRGAVRLALTEGAGKPLEQGELRGVGFGYLAGQGLSKPQARRALLTRSALAAPCGFSVRVTARDLDDGDLRRLRDALVLLGLAGGLGSRSRRGMGSVVVEELQGGANVEGFVAPGSPEDLAEAFRVLLAPRSVAGTPPFTAVSAATEWRVVRGQKNVGERHESLGRHFLRFRSHGRGGRDATGAKAEQNFRSDHDLVAAFLDGGPPDRPPARVAFGLPHNYFFSSQRAKVGIGPRGYDRRASPLLFHLHEAGGIPCAVVLFLPARFLPDGERIRMKNKHERLVPVPGESELWRPIRDYLGRLDRADAAEDGFTPVPLAEAGGGTPG